MLAFICFWPHKQTNFAAHRNDEKLEKIVQCLSKAEPSPNLHSARKKKPDRNWRVIDQRN